MNDMGFDTETLNEIVVIVTLFLEVSEEIYVFFLNN